MRGWRRSCWSSQGLEWRGGPLGYTAWMCRCFVVILAAAGLLAALPGAHALQPRAAPAPSSSAAAGRKSVSQGAGCLPGGNGYLRARIRGALNLDIDWHNNEIECDGEPRPNGSS